MRLLGDENFPERLLRELRAEGHDVSSALADHRGTSDNNLLDIAEREKRILLTLDKDYLKLTAQLRKPLRSGGVVLFRVHPATIAALRPMVVYLGNSGRDWTGRLRVLSILRGGQITVREA